MTSDNQPLVSVVTPVHNGEKFLDQCIESVLRQTYTQWEYIIVDNCSTDRTADIAAHYARSDARIRVIRNEQFVGVNQNHNIAFRRISPDSRYCKPVHADDWLFPDCIRQMVQVAEEHPSVGIVSAYRLDGAQVTLQGLPYPSTLVPGHQVCRQSLLGEYYVFGSPTSLLIRSDLIRQRSTFFPETSPHADTESCYDVLRDWDFGFVHQVLTFTRRHPEAGSSRSQRWNTYLLLQLRLLKIYGPVYLSVEEYQQLHKATMKEYYSFLASKTLGRMEKGFWDFHRNGMQELGYPFSRSRLVRSYAVRAIKTSLSLEEWMWRVSRLLGGSNNHRSS